MTDNTQFIDFINSNWNKKLTLYKSSNLPFYEEDKSYNPNTANNGSPVYGMPSDLFYDIQSNTIYFRLSNNTITPWAQFGSGYESAYSNSESSIIGINVGHLSKNTTIAELTGLSLSQIIDKILIKEYEPIEIEPICNYEILDNEDNIITDKYFEVGSNIDIKLNPIINYGEWRIKDLDLKISDYALQLNSPAYTYQKIVNGSSENILSTNNITIKENENIFNVYANLKGIHAKVTNLNNELIPENINYSYTTNVLNQKNIIGNYYTFIGTSINNNILTCSPRLFIGNGLTKLKDEPIIVTINNNIKYIVVYIKGDYTLDDSYKLEMLNEKGDTLSEIKFNKIPELINVDLLNDTTIQYTKQVLSFLMPTANKIYLKLTI